MCTRVLWPEAGGSVLVGRNMDFASDLLTNLWVQPRGIERDDAVEGELTWTSKYGSVVAGAYDITTADGLNEAGFGAHLLWLAESDYGNPPESGTRLNISVWMQYYLDNFATVAEAVEWTEQTNVGIVPMKNPTGGKDPALHLAIEDSSGDSAIIEYVDGKPKVYHSKDYWVMTNSPTFDKQLEYVKEITGLGGDKPIPGSTDARDRFDRASYYVTRLAKPKTQLEGVAAMFSVIRNAAQPFREPDPGKPEASQTLWQVVLDLTNKRYIYESTTAPNIVWVDFKDLDFSAGAPQKKLDLVNHHGLGEGSYSGDVSADFEEGTLTFFSQKIEAELAAAAKAQAENK